MKRLTILSLILAALLLAACGGGSTAGDPAQIVVDYLQAKTDSDEEKIRSTLCAAREADARREAASFAAVEASLEDVQCTFDSATNTVSCTGAIVAIYNGEGRDIPPGNYSVVQEDGEWRVCGEAE